jgi:alanyl-tRNA synthetase
MTERLYYVDSYLWSFDATIERVERGPEHGGQVVLFLDRTAFYPTSGGQPFDTGTLAGYRVVDVFDHDDGSIAHLLQDHGDSSARDGVRSGAAGGSKTGDEREPVGLHPGRMVRGAVDRERRFDHMQQHTGQHVLSAAFDHLFGVRTVSFHLGAESSTIDLARETTPAEIAAAEEEANRIVWEDRPVAIRFVSSDEAARMPLRKEPARAGTLRLIDVEGFDLSACGGTHVARTGAIGIIVVASWERFRGGQRLEFLCGRRALRRFDAWRDSLTSAVRLLSVLPETLPSAIERLQAEARDHKRVVIGLEGELARYRGDDLVRAAEASTAGRLILRAIDTDANGLKALAVAVVSRPGHIAVLASTSRPALVAVARSPDLAVSSRELVATLIATFGGRGGGKAELAQAGGLDGSSDAILAAARTAILGA